MQADVQSFYIILMLASGIFSTESPVIASQHMFHFGCYSRCSFSFFALALISEPRPVAFESGGGGSLPLRMSKNLDLGLRVELN